MDADRMYLGQQCFEANKTASFGVIADKFGWYTPSGLPARGKVEHLIRDYKRVALMPPITSGFTTSGTITWPPPSPFKAHQKPKTDQERWGEAKGDLSINRYITVAHRCDLHMPRVDKDALELSYQLDVQKQPDIIVVGSDTADFSVLSSFTPDPDDEEQISDALEDFNTLWAQHIKRLRQAAPSATFVYIYGNHEWRLHAFLATHAPKLRKTVDKAWQETIRCGGEVLFLGKIQEVEIGNLLVKHGDVEVEHAAKALLDKESYQMSVMAGHVHRLTNYSRVGRHYPVVGATSGCLEEIYPPWMDTPPKFKWEHGTAYAVVDMKGKEVFIDNIPFRRQDDGRLIAVTGGQIVTLKAA